MPRRYPLVLLTAACLERGGLPPDPDAEPFADLAIVGFEAPASLYVGEGAARLELEIENRGAVARWIVDAGVACEPGGVLQARPLAQDLAEVQPGRRALVRLAAHVDALAAPGIVLLTPVVEAA